MASIQGFDKLVAKLSALGGNVEKAVKIGVHQGVKLVQGEAKGLAPVNDGQLRNSIFAEVEAKDGRIEGRVFTNVEHAAYVEFGTGPIGMSSDKKGIPAKVLNRLHYKQNGWWIHESQIDAKDAEKYHFFRMETDNGVYYYTEGQPAQPYLYPALARSEQRVKTMVRKKLQEEIQRLGGT